MPAPTPSSIYFDYNATTPLDAGVRQVMVEALDGPWGNPSSVHRLGRLARAALDDARDRLAALLNCRPAEIVFTGGGSEANNLAIFGAARARRDRGRHLICTGIEHHAVLHCFERLAHKEDFTLTILPVDASGVVSPEDVERALRPDTVLVSVMAANNETGILQPVADIGRICRRRGILFHTDAVQWFGKEAVSSVHQFEADLVAVCAHKFHGPKGAGLLYVRSPLPLQPILLGGGHELDRRAGTENLVGILGLEAAMARFVPEPAFKRPVLEPWISRIGATLSAIPGVTVITGDMPRLANTLAFTVLDSDSLALLANLDLAGIAASSGSACSSGSLTPSHVLRAMGFPPHQAASLVRFSLGRENTAQEVDSACALLPHLIARSRCREDPARHATPG